MNIEGSAEIYQDVNKSSQDHTNLLRNSRSIVNLNIEYQAKSVLIHCDAQFFTILL